ncbi:MAG: hypothetical protein IJ313_06555 [Clostridia bacterium]|nr:hypothetical protein [Clostridia bacterium]
MKKLKLVLLALVWAALLAPFFLGAPAAHPATDDFTFAAYTHPTWEETGSILHVLKDAVSYALRTWRDWQGTVTGVVIMTLNPIVFSLEHYWVHAAALLALHLVSWLVAFGHVFGRRLGLARGLWLRLYLVLSAFSLMFLPDMVEGIYWFNGAWFYTGAQTVALLTLVLCDRFAVTRAGRKTQVFMGIVCCGLLFALGMDNYITAMMTAAVLGMMTLQRLWAAMKTPRAAMIGRIVYGPAGVLLDQKRAFGGLEERKLQRRAALRSFLLLAPLGAGLVLSVIAPGNSVRMATDGAHQAGYQWLISSVLWTMRDAAFYFARFMFKTPLLALLIALTPTLAKAVDGMEERAWRTPPVLFTVLATYLTLCAMIIPHMYSSGYAGSGRVVNMYHLYVLLAVPVCYVLILLRMKPRRLAELSDGVTKKTCAVLSIAALIVCLALGQGGNYLKLVRDQQDGTQEAYIAQYQNEYALCEAAGEADIVELPAWTVQTMTGKLTAYEDETMWTNQAMAGYFGVKAVKAVNPEAVEQIVEPAVPAESAEIAPEPISAEQENVE